MRYRLRLALFFLITLVGCTHSARFERLSARQTGLDFENTINESDSLNVLEFEYIYNGGGVGVGDFNGDGRQDIFFAGNQVSSRMYLNLGDFNFEDVTASAGVGTKLWCTGVAVADVNQDGRQDIYVSTIHPDRSQAVPNLLFINQGNDANGSPRFREMAQVVGLADSSYSTQAAFLDYDRDGDLDVFLLTNALEAYNRNTVTGPRNDGSARSRDKLFRNDGPGTNGMPHFTDVSKQAGLVHEGWGLGVVVNDINQDNWPDIYVANDFQSNDVWLINNQRGGFVNRVAEALRHQSHNSMGVDLADINNDGLNDLAVVDMLPDDNLRQKTMFASVPYDRFQMARRLGYQPQYIRNVLQLNRGKPAQEGDSANAMPLFSDISYLAGTAATDWSWSALFADLDNDGLRDLLITNGYRKDITDLDFTSYNWDAGTFGSDADRRAGLLRRIADLEPVYKPNFLFHNQKNLTFTNVAGDWGLTEPSFTNGTAYADFDNDGDLDLVMNNINDPAFIYRNQTIEKAEQPGSNHFLRLNLLGKPGNREGLGAKVVVWAGGQRYYAEYTRQRGYQSTMESGIHLGLGKAERIDSLKILWPTGSGQRLRNLNVNQTLLLEERHATPEPVSFLKVQAPIKPLLTEVSASLGLTFQHSEDDFVDYKAQQTLLTHKHSQIGPGIAVGDVDGNGFDDIYVAGAAQRGGTFFLQQTNERFQRRDRPAKTPEETGVLLFDADGDKDLDLYAVHGSTEFGRNEARYQDSLYLNDGRGNFQSAPQALPRITASGSCVVAADYDQDGDLDLFVGGRVVPQRFPEPAQSYLLRNDSRAGQAHFTDVTKQVAPDLAQVGLVCAALWTNIDNDNWPDLMLTGEFMPVTVLRNQNGQRLASLPTPSLDKATGFWNSLTAGDFDNDGDLDYIAGNLGRNSRFQASADRPVSVYAADYDKNGTLDPILSVFNGQTEVPFHPRDVLTDQIPLFKKRMTSFAAYGKMKLSDLLSADEQKQAIIRRVTYLSSAYIENRGGTLIVHELPVEAQFSPVFGTVATDLNHDGNLDVLLAGNDYAAEVLSGWLDAGLGLCLLGDGHGHFKPLSLRQSGFLVDGDAKALATILMANGRLGYVSTQNNGPLRVFTLADSSTIFQRLQLSDAPNRRTSNSGLSWGGGYLSQSSQIVPARAVTIKPN
ncbi:VCBS repeat-containing protein [Spirosoma taeanense]|uniref:VCBS repeat-containing protein n=1 Tax=Spirosoma taeanense TaxID=2735870 RepID=A0A6M5YF19_9BACT|nr:VCBS repeat-containing protein [Spirosoma taeanense]QJW91873.1 VCBS repeat-containing protein [Spirosoma taeanense]